MTSCNNDDDDDDDDDDGHYYVDDGDDDNNTLERKIGRSTDLLKRPDVAADAKADVQWDSNQEINQLKMSWASCTQLSIQLRFKLVIFWYGD